jgi:uncharacterized peroxidase-related enzyme
VADASFLTEPPESDAARRLFDDDRKEDGYVWNVTRLWAWRPELLEQFVALRTGLMQAWTLTDRDRAVLVAATASTLGDSYCSFAWGDKLATLTDDTTAAAVLAGEPRPEGLDAREAALGEWARQVVRDPNGATSADVDRLRAAGLDDREIFDATFFVALRLAFSTVNDALGAPPDTQLVERVPEPVRRTVTYGRQPARP